jgi:hypothetical protein
MTGGPPAVRAPVRGERHRCGPLHAIPRGGAALTAVLARRGSGPPVAEVTEQHGAATVIRVSCGDARFAIALDVPATTGALRDAAVVAAAVLNCEPEDVLDQLVSSSVEGRR